MEGSVPGTMQVAQANTSPLTASAREVTGRHTRYPNASQHMKCFWTNKKFDYGDSLLTWLLLSLFRALDFRSGGLCSLGLFFSFILGVPGGITPFSRRHSWPCLGEIASSLCVSWALLWVPVFQCGYSLRFMGFAPLPWACSNLYISAGSWVNVEPFSLPKSNLWHLGC